METSILDLTDAIAAFICKQQIRVQGSKSSNNSLDRRKKDSL